MKRLFFLLFVLTTLTATAQTMSSLPSLLTVDSNTLTFAQPIGSSMTFKTKMAAIGRFIAANYTAQAGNGLSMTGNKIELGNGLNNATKDITIRTDTFSYTLGGMFNSFHSTFFNIYNKRSLHYGLFCSPKGRILLGDNGTGNGYSLLIDDTAKFYQFGKLRNGFMKVDGTGKVYVDSTSGGGGGPWSTSGGDIYPSDLSKRIGIGIDVPDFSLDVRGDVNIDLPVADFFNWGVSPTFLGDGNLTENYKQFYTEGGDTLLFFRSGMVKANNNNSNVSHVEGCIRPGYNQQVIMEYGRDSDMNDIYYMVSYSNGNVIYNGFVINNKGFDFGLTNVNTATTVSDSTRNVVFKVTNSHNVLVNGHLTINDGTQAAGSLLASDASGKSSWQPADTLVDRWAENKPEYANDTDAGAGGVPNGKFYYNTTLHALAKRGH